MSVELIDNCVLFPHPIDWSEPCKWRRTFNTTVSPAVTSAEDRQSNLLGDNQRIEYRILPLKIGEQARLEARILEASKTGRACAPLWGRAQEASLINFPVPSIGPAVIPVGSVWFWQPGDKFIFVRKNPNGVENRVLLLNAAGGDLMNYFDDAPFIEFQGAPFTRSTVNPINFPAYGYPVSYDVTPQAIYQSSRGSSRGMAWTLTGFEQDVQVRITLHFAVLDLSVTSSPATQEIFRVKIGGKANETSSLINPFVDCGSLHETAIQYSFTARARVDGSIQVFLDSIDDDGTANGIGNVSVNSIEAYQLQYEVMTAATGTQPGRVVTTALTQGAWEPGDQFYPMIFGRLMAQEMRGVTNRNAPTVIAIEEPPMQIETPVTCPALDADAIEDVPLAIPIDPVKVLSCSSPVLAFAQFDDAGVPDGLPAAGPIVHAIGLRASSVSAIDPVDLAFAQKKAVDYFNATGSAALHPEYILDLLYTAGPLVAWDVTAARTSNTWTLISVGAGWIVLIKYCP